MTIQRHVHDATADGYSGRLEHAHDYETLEHRHYLDARDSNQPNVESAETTFGFGYRIDSTPTVPDHRLAITLRTDDYRGDHAADVEIAYSYDPWLRLAVLVDEIGRNRYGAKGKIKPTDVVEIRRIANSENRP